MRKSGSKQPFDSDIIRPKTRRFDETIVFVPFFNGKMEQLRRHVEFTSSLGYTSAVMEFRVPRMHWNPFKLLSKDRHFGLKHVWADHVEYFLDRIGGPKIIFGFSGPSSCAFEALARRRREDGRLDVKAVICDSGPFYHDRYCNRSRLYLERGIHNPLLLSFAVGLHQRIWSRNHEKSLGDSLSKLPQNFPVLSIRGMEDVLVPPWTIDSAFREQKHLSLEVLDLEKIGHLKGLKDAPEIYKSKVTEFLNKVSQPI